MLKVALIGFGGVAQAAHLPAYRNLQEQGKARLVAACDIDPQRFTKAMEINIGGAQDGSSMDFHRYSDWEEMLACEEVDMVDVCLPTFLHAQTAVELLKRGYHVLSEKPMALDYEQSMAMVEAANQAKGQLMIGQCLRFASSYTFLKDAIEAGTFGKPLSAVFRRMSEPPIWGWDNWFMDYERSRGCLLDMHIHDIDMIRFLFGEPDAVSCMTQDVYSRDDIAHSRLMYPDLSVLAIGDWSQEGTGFTADYRVAFEKATVVLDGEGVTVYPRGGEAYKPELSEKSFYEAEIEFFMDLVKSGAANVINPPNSAATTVKLIDTLRESARSGGSVRPFKKA
ncbi:MAG: Gfo/Idh/MocA family oxidoreductase [Oscillospiraceae bacterium]|nr:Gfo/Idh/MocA family oxidoreductase [Oscillospiraceae bacterium]